MSKLDATLDAAELALGVLATPLGASINPAVPAVAALLARIERVAQAAVLAHEQIAGVPLDLARLHRIEPLPVEEDDGA